MLRRKLAILLSARAKDVLPEGIKKVDCVYANGNAYISSLLYGNSNTKMEIVFDIANLSTQNRGSMGSRGNSANSQLLAIGYGTSTAASDFNNSSYSTYRSYIEYNPNTKYRVYTSKEKRSFIDEATGTVLAENNTLCNDNMSTGVLLLGAETGLNYRHIGNIYSAKIWNGSTLVRDYIPVVDSSNRGALYDRVTKTVQYSDGSSDFVGYIIRGGVAYGLVNYIESTGTQYINTGVKLTQDHTFDLDFQLTSASQHRTGLFGGLCNQNSGYSESEYGRYGMLTHYQNNRLEIGYGKTNTAQSAVSTDTSRHFYHQEKNKVYYNGSLLYTFPTATFAMGGDAFIGGFNYTNYTPALAKYYSSKIINGTTVVRDYIPVLKNGEAGMLDLENNQFYGNAGTGQFNYGY